MLISIFSYTVSSLLNIYVYFTKSSNLIIGSYTITLKEVYKFLSHIFGALFALASTYCRDEWYIDSLVAKERIAALHSFESVAIY